MAPAGGPRVWMLSALAAAVILGAAEPVLANEDISCYNPSDPGPPGSDRDLGAGPQEDAASDRSGSSSRIVNGSDCERDTQPWQGALLLGPGQLYCGAVLVAPQWLLTAAHCRKPVFRVRLGHHSMSPVYESGQQMFKGIKSIPHPGYSHPGHSNDLMLIKLNRKVRESRTVKAINISSCCPSAGTRCTVSGWGTTNNSQRERPASSLCPRHPPAPARPCSPRLSLRSHSTDAFPKVLQCLNITVLSEERCKEAYPGQIDHSMFCAGDEEGRDSCQVRLPPLPRRRTWGACSVARKPVMAKAARTPLNLFFKKR
uniref:Kallikrein related peptidase 5 n=1 Tax=Oryctolagus cuniculus TaxID=9986 RepID=A0A5F9DU07_RABIT